MNKIVSKIIELKLNFLIKKSERALKRYVKLTNKLMREAGIESISIGDVIAAGKNVVADQLACKIDFDNMNTTIESKD